MKDIKLNVTVKYTVEVAMTVSDNVFESLEHMQEEYPYGFNVDIIDPGCSYGGNFLETNIREQDAYEWAYEINDLEEIKDNGEEKNGNQESKKHGV